MSTFSVLNPPDSAKGKNHLSPLEQQAKYITKFRDQRNLYLTGVGLLMAFVVSQYYNLLVHSVELEGRVRESRTSTGAVAELNREIDDFRRQVNDLNSENKELAEKLKKAERKIGELSAVPEPTSEATAPGDSLEDMEPDTVGVGLRKRQ